MTSAPVLMDSLLLTYVLFTTVLVVTPGSTTAVVIRNSLAGGHRAGLATACGAALANTTHAVAAGLGLSVILRGWPEALDAVRVAGAMYLAWLGARSLGRAFWHPDGGFTVASDDAAPAIDYRPSLREGLAVNLLNPVIITFYVVVVPTFIPENAWPGYFTMLAAVHVGLALVCHAAWATAFHHIRRSLDRPSRKRLIELAAGLALVALAARVLWRG
jgi:threonine/homoserine/homoserine lactone efflux protein